MQDLIFYDRIQFAFTISFHYLFPQLTMGLSLIIVFFKWKFLRTNETQYDVAAKFLMKIFAINFLLGVITGIPLEFQFGTNFAKFSELTGEIIGQTLAMEGTFSFIMESAFLALFIYGEKWMSPKLHFLSAFMVFLGSWLSGFLIIATNSWMQYPMGYEILANGKYVLTHFTDLFSNPFLYPAFLHNQCGSVITASFVVSCIGAFYILNKQNEHFGKLLVKWGVIFGLPATLLVAFPTGDWNAKNVAKYQAPGFAAMEGIFHTQEKGSEIVLIGQPNTETKTLDNPISVPNLLSFLTFQDPNKPVPGLDKFSEDEIPTNIPGLYYAYHIMIGLGTIFILIMALALFFLWRGILYKQTFILWMLMLLTPFAYIANLAGWYTTELARQPWLVYGLMRTSEGVSPYVSAGNTLFTLLGFMGLYLLLGLLFAVLFLKILFNGPEKYN